jgi:hypothetical protein
VAEMVQCYTNFAVVMVFVACWCFVCNGYAFRSNRLVPYRAVHVLRPPVHRSPLQCSQPIDTSIQTKMDSSVLVNVKNLLSGAGWKGNYSLTRKSLAKLGLNVLLAYGFVSNVSYITCVILAWISHGRAYKLSPLAPGQWKYYLLIYAGYFAANNILRPLRFSASLVLSPFFERMVVGLEKRLRINKTLATALLVFLVNVVGSTSYLVFGLLVATKWAGVPLLP